jgi:hypothetical protein
MLLPKNQIRSLRAFINRRTRSAPDRQEVAHALKNVDASENIAEIFVPTEQPHGSHVPRNGLVVAALRTRHGYRETRAFVGMSPFRGTTSAARGRWRDDGWSQFRDEPLPQGVPDRPMKHDCA